MAHGAGRSDPGPYTLAAYADAIEAVRTHVGAGPVALVGLSFGGGLPALEYVRSGRSAAA